MKLAVAAVLVAALTFAHAAPNAKGVAARETVIINGVSYELQHEAKTWNEADATCVGLGMTLVSLETEAKDLDIGHWLSDNDFGDEYLWSAGVKSGTGFVWSHDGSAFSYDRWYPGEPDDESWDICVLFQGKNGWHDYSCDYSYGFMCQPV